MTARQEQGSVPATALVPHDIHGIAAHEYRLDFRPEHPVPVTDRFTIEAPCSKRQGIFDPQGSTIYSNRSLTPQQAAGNVLAPGFIFGVASGGHDALARHRRPAQ
jgi:hypothetical protein